MAHVEAGRAARPIWRRMLKPCRIQACSFQALCNGHLIYQYVWTKLCWCETYLRVIMSKQLWQQVDSSSFPPSFNYLPRRKNHLLKMNSFDYRITRCISHKSEAEFTMPNFCNYGYASSLEPFPYQQLLQDFKASVLSTMPKLYLSLSFAINYTHIQLLASVTVK